MQNAVQRQCELKKRKGFVMTPILKTEGLTHRYSVGTPFENTAIEAIDLEIPKGQFVGLIGHTGSGKSTFIQHLNGLLRPTAGTVYYEGKNIFASKIATRDVRFKVGLVFQYPEYQLFEETVYADIAFGPKNQKLKPHEWMSGCVRRPNSLASARSCLKSLRWSCRAARSAALPLRA